MAKLRITAVGAGSYVFGPSLLREAIHTHRFGDDVTLVLHDVDANFAEQLAAAGRHLAAHHGVGVRVESKANRRDAFEGADFVVCSAAVAPQRTFQQDLAILKQHYPNHLVTEFGGVAGFSSTLRQVRLINDLCDDMLAACPDAWLLDSANPLQRVCQAAIRRGVTKTTGFCHVSTVAYKQLWQVLVDRDATQAWPFHAARERFALTLGGVNHLTFVLAGEDRATQENVLPKLRELAGIEDSAIAPVTRALLKQTGFLPASGDDHIRDFLPPTSGATAAETTSHGNASARDERRRVVQALATGTGEIEPLEASLFATESWEKPLDFVATIHTGGDATFP
ncbi:MAG: hypothetical protein AAGK78_07880, partial [Planctomycetota bacterium]